MFTASDLFFPQQWSGLLFLSSLCVKSFFITMYFWRMNRADDCVIVACHSFLSFLFICTLLHTPSKQQNQNSPVNLWSCLCSKHATLIMTISVQTVCQPEDELQAEASLQDLTFPVETHSIKFKNRIKSRSTATIQPKADVL